MEVLKERILKEGKHLGGGILKVDSFINHQVDAQLTMLLGREFARRFGYLKPTKVLTAEISGIAPALATAFALDVPLPTPARPGPSPCRKTRIGRSRLPTQRGK